MVAIAKLSRIDSAGKMPVAPPVAGQIGDAVADGLAEALDCGVPAAAGARPRPRRRRGATSPASVSRNRSWPWPSRPDSPTISPARTASLNAALPAASARPAARSRRSAAGLSHGCALRQDLGRHPRREAAPGVASARSRRLDDLAAAQDRDAVGEAQDLVHAVGDEEDQAAFRAPGARSGVKTVSRSVKSSAAVTSSRIRMRGSRTRARASTTSCCVASGRLPRRRRRDRPSVACTARQRVGARSRAGRRAAGGGGRGRRSRAGCCR